MHDFDNDDTARSRWMLNDRATTYMSRSMYLDDKKDDSETSMDRTVRTSGRSTSYLIVNNVDNDVDDHNDSNDDDNDSNDDDNDSTDDALEREGSDIFPTESEEPSSGSFLDQHFGHNATKDHVKSTTPNNDGTNSGDRNTSNRFSRFLMKSKSLSSIRSTSDASFETGKRESNSSVTDRRSSLLRRWSSLSKMGNINDLEEESSHATDDNLPSSDADTSDNNSNNNNANEEESFVWKEEMSSHWADLTSTHGDYDADFDDIYHNNHHHNESLHNSLVNMFEAGKKTLIESLVDSHIFTMEEEEEEGNNNNDNITLDATCRGEYYFEIVEDEDEDDSVIFRPTRSASMDSKHSMPSTKSTMTGGGGGGRHQLQRSGSVRSAQTERTHTTNATSPASVVSELHEQQLYQLHKQYSRAELLEILKEIRCNEAVSAIIHKKFHKIKQEMKNQGYATDLALLQVARNIVETKMIHEIEKGEVRRYFLNSFRHQGNAANLKRSNSHDSTDNNNKNHNINAHNAPHHHNHNSNESNKSSSNNNNQEDSPSNEPASPNNDNNNNQNPYNNNSNINSDNDNDNDLNNRNTNTSTNQENNNNNNHGFPPMLSLTSSISAVVIPSSISSFVTLKRQNSWH